jgi:hypothetical protein
MQLAVPVFVAAAALLHGAVAVGNSSQIAAAVEFADKNWNCLDVDCHKTCVRASVLCSRRVSVVEEDARPTASAAMERARLLLLLALLQCCMHCLPLEPWLATRLVAVKAWRGVC